eukprot:EG_transcript_8551
MSFAAADPAGPALPADLDRLRPCRGPAPPHALLSLPLPSSPPCPPGSSVAVGIPPDAEGPQQEEAAACPQSPVSLLHLPLPPPPPEWPAVEKAPPPPSRSSVVAALALAAKACAAVLLLVAVLAGTKTAFQHGRREQWRTTTARLESAQESFRLCNLECRMLQEEEAGMRMEVHESVQQQEIKRENDLMRKENNELSLYIVDLERFVDDLREELNDKYFISDDEALALEETLALGNNSRALAELLESASFSEETDIVVGKHELIGMLLFELKLKQVSLARCMAEKRVAGKFEPQMLWEDMNEEQRAAVLRAQVKKIALLQKASPREAEELVQFWGPKHHGGIPGLMVAVAKREAAKASQQRRGPNLPTSNAAPQ